MTPTQQRTSSEAAHAAAPVSTYRLQLHAGFTFEQARAISDYLKQLGVSHAYTSPYLRATPGSTHGYDVIDHSVVNPEVGTNEDRTRWVESLRANGLSHIIDVVPNHMGVATSENRWWNDVLEYGPQSDHAGHFDIAWDDPPRAASKGKVLLPILGDRYSKVVRSNDVGLAFDRSLGAFSLTLYGRPLPIAPSTYPLLFSKILQQDLPGTVDETPESGAAMKAGLARQCKADEKFAGQIEAKLKAFNESADAAGRFEALHRLLEAQHYRLVHWLATNGEINYRRFFDVPSLAAIRMEKQGVFDEAHKLIKGWMADGSVTGLRIDHPDGLANPAHYFERLQTLNGNGEPVYVLAEKILGAEEALVKTWPIAGTSGYDFLNQVNGLFVDPSAAGRMTQTYEAFIGRQVNYRSLVIANKKRICDESMAGELTMLAERLDAIAQRNVDARDYSFVQIRSALRELVASFPIYRTYISGGVASEDDRKYLTEALEIAKRNLHRTHHDLLDFIQGTILGSTPDEQQFAERFQQFTSPVMAKGVEDTTFYQYNRLLSLNEVGGEPEQFGLMAHKVHEYFARRAQDWPGAMSTLSTHDTKRSEDVRARLNVLSEIPDRWAQTIETWSQLNESLRKPINGSPAPDRNDEYAFYQLLLGIWPWGGGVDAGADGSFSERIVSTVRKSLREAKAKTSWIEPNEEYEAAAIDFVQGLLNSRRSGAFLKAFAEFVKDVSLVGAINSLAQSTLKLMAPGVPDTYQGTELIDLSLVDPDNRRPVDYEHRRTLLNTLPAFREGLCKNGLQLDADSIDCAKLLIHHALLQSRQQHHELMSAGDYVPVATQGPRHANVFAFMRTRGNTRMLVAIPRLVARDVIEHGVAAFARDEWRNTRFVSGVDGKWQNVLLQREVTLSGDAGSMSDLFSRLPVAVLLAKG